MHNLLLCLIEGQLRSRKRAALDVFEPEHLFFRLLRNNPRNYLLYLRDEPYQYHRIGDVEQGMHRRDTVQQR